MSYSGWPQQGPQHSGERATSAPGFGSPSGPGPAPQPPSFGAPPQTSSFSGPPQPDFGGPQGAGGGQPQAPGFGQPQRPGFGQPQAPGFGQPQAPGFGHPQHQGAHAHPQAFGSPPQPGGVGAPPGKRRGLPLWGWLVMGAAALAVVALVAVLVLPGLVGGDGRGETVEVSVPVYEGELSLADAVTVDSDPIVAVDRGSEWMAGGVYLYDDGREQQYPAAGSDCLGITLVETGQSGIEGKSSDEEATRSANEELFGDGQGDVVQLAAYGGGTVEFLSVERQLELSGASWVGWSATRAFAGSGAVVTVMVLCQAERDLDDAVTDFQARASIVLDVA